MFYIFLFLLLLSSFCCTLTDHVPVIVSAVMYYLKKKIIMDASSVDPLESLPRCSQIEIHIANFYDLLAVKLDVMDQRISRLEERNAGDSKTVQLEFASLGGSRKRRRRRFLTKKKKLITTKTLKK